MPQKKYSLESKNPYTTVWNLAWPQVLLMFYHFWIGMADVFVAGKINFQVQGALGVISSCLFFMLILAVSVASGGATAISQSIGAGRLLRAKRYGCLCLALAFCFSILLVGVGLPGRDLLISLLQIPPGSREIMKDIFPVFIILLPAYYALLTSNAIFRARREMTIPARTMLFVTLINIWLDFGLGLGYFGFPDMGYMGIAWATFYSVSFGALFNLFILWRKELFRFSVFPSLRWIRQGIVYLFKVAWPAGIMQIAWQTGYLTLWAVVGSLPENADIAMAGMAVGLRIESLLFLLGAAFNMTASVLVGNYLGAGDKHEAKRFGYRVWAIGVASIIVLAAVLWQFADPFIAFLVELSSTAQTEESLRQAMVREEAGNYLYFNLLAIPFTLTSMIIGGALVGAGATLYNFMVFGLTIWCIRLPLAFILGHYVLGQAKGVWIAMLVSQIVQAFVILWVFHYKNWARFGMMQQKKQVAS